MQDDTRKECENEKTELEAENTKNYVHIQTLKDTWL